MLHWKASFKMFVNFDEQAFLEQYEKGVTGMLVAVQRAAELQSA